jgi:NAD(P)-dependent dehydrogenase (short-subunit alcohol dehydrogenase family)
MEKRESNNPSKRSVLITGVSSGLGLALARRYLSGGFTVFGLSRRKPPDLSEGAGFHHASVDLAGHALIPEALERLLPENAKLDLALLNAGTAGRFGDTKDTPLELIKSVMDVNAWANKVILDFLCSRRVPPSQVVAISTGASITGHRGWNAYSLSKAALNMLMRLYSREVPDTHFTALAPGLVDTPMLQSVMSLPSDNDFPTIARMKSKRGTPELLTPDQAAEKLLKIIDRLPESVESGSYVDSRQMG